MTSNLLPDSQILGLAASGPTSYGGRLVDVIGEVEGTAVGNFVLRVGQMLDGGGWTQTAHVVLTSDEVDRLALSLGLVRQTNTGATPARRFQVNDKVIHSAQINERLTVADVDGDDIYVIDAAGMYHWVRADKLTKVTDAVCVDCERAPGALQVDPFAADVYDDKTKVVLCEPCVSKRRDEI